jgi:hypothetical protein
MALDRFDEILKELHEYRVIDEFRGEYASYVKERKYIYGTTPYQTFKGVIDNVSDVGRNVLVLGSSIGWFPIYFKHYLNVDVVGLDLHVMRHEFAKKTINKYGLNDIELQLMDFNDYDLDNVDFIWMNNYTFSDDIDYTMVYNRGITFVSYVKPNNIPDFYDINVVNGTVGWSAEPISFYILNKIKI